MATHPDSFVCGDEGLTIREHFACEMLKGILSSGSAPNQSREDTVEVAISYADLLIAKLNKEEQL